MLVPAAQGLSNGAKLTRETSLGSMRDPLVYIRGWLLWCVWCTVAGWGLSLMGRLDGWGYFGAGLASAVAVGVWAVRTGYWRRVGCEVRMTGHRLRRRMRKPLPAGYAGLWLLAFVGGCIHAPSNGDALLYRLPRMLAWLQAGRWHWIEALDPRQNFLTTGTEWVSLPILVLTQSDRLLFVIHAASFALLPGALFLLFRGLGLRRRVCWNWMWLTAAGWCFVLQAGGIANDLFGVVLAASAVGMILRARRWGSLCDWSCAVLAAALVTNVKQTNAAVLLPWAVGIVVAWRIPWRRPGVALVVMGVAAVASMLPNTCINLAHTGHWLGYSDDAYQPRSLWIGLLVNGPLLVIRNLLPPFFPWATAWNERMEAFVQTPLGEQFNTFNRFGQLARGASEGTAGFGLVPWLLVVASVMAAWSWRRRNRACSGDCDWAVRVARHSIWISAVVFAVKVGALQNARHFAPYYPFVVASLLGFPGQERLPGRAWWRRAAWGTMLISLVLLVTDRVRPLWPARSVLGWATSQWPGIQLLGTVYRSYNYIPQLEHCGREIVRCLPPDEGVVGVAAVYGREADLWKPYGSRRVVQFPSNVSLAALSGARVKTLLVDDLVLECREAGSLGESLRHGVARIVHTLHVRPRPEGPPAAFYVVSLRPSESR